MACLLFPTPAWSVTLLGLDSSVFSRERLLVFPSLSGVVDLRILVSSSRFLGLPSL